MVFGTVAYVMKVDASKEIELDWSARAEFVWDEQGVVKMRYYQVYLVSFYRQLKEKIFYVSGECKAKRYN